MNIPRPLAVVLFAAPWAVAIIAAVWLAVLRFPPSGIFHVSTDLDGSSAWIFPLLPAERVTSPGIQSDGWTGQRIFRDPTYFTARVPGPYDTVDITMEFRLIRQPLIELGMVRDSAGTQLEMRPIYASQLEQSDWSRASYNGIFGFVRNGTHPSRLSDLNTRGLAVWDASTTSPLMQDSPAPEKVTDVSLRGAHDFYIVPTDHVRMTFEMQSANRNKGNDLAVFRVFHGNKEISREAFDVSGSRDARMGRIFKHTINVSHVEPGVYRIRFQADDDIFIRKIITPNTRWVVGPRLVFGDTVGYATTTIPGRVWTNSRHLVAETFHIEGLQTIDLAGQSYPLTQTHALVRIDRSDDLPDPVELRVPDGDVRFIGDGFFAFTPDAFFEPKPRRFNSSTNLNNERINAVITTYQRPEPLGGGWFRVTQHFALDPTLDQLRFVVSAPGVFSRSGAVDIRQIDLTYHRNAVTLSDWFHTLRQELVNAWHRL